MAVKVKRERPDQRRHHRVTAPLFVDFDGHFVRAADWSLGGLRIEAFPGSLPEVGAEIAFEVTLPFQGFDDPFATRGFAVADLNEDGWLDIAKREVGGVVVLSLSRCGDAHGLDVVLDDPGRPNRAAIGAVVEIDVGGRTVQRVLTAGSSSYDASGPPVVWFGLGSADHVDALRVTWPTGERTVHPGVPADQRVTVTYAEPLTR